MQLWALWRLAGTCLLLRGWFARCFRSLQLSPGRQEVRPHAPGSLSWRGEGNSDWILQPQQGKSVGFTAAVPVTSAAGGSEGCRRRAPNEAVCIAYRKQGGVSMVVAVAKPFAGLLLSPLPLKRYS